MPTTRTSNIFSFEVEASAAFTFPTIGNMKAIASGSTVTQDIDITDLGVPAIALSNISLGTYSDSNATTALVDGTDDFFGILTLTVVDADTIRLALNPSTIADADAGTAYGRLSVSQPDADD